MKPSVDIAVDESTKSLRALAFITYFTAIGLQNTEIHPVIYGEAVRLISKYMSLLDLSNLSENYMVKIYRKYLWRIGIDPTKQRPSHEAILRRILKSRTFPQINAIVDAGNLVSLKHLVPIGIYDLKKISSEIVIRLSISGEIFNPIGASTALSLPQGKPVLADHEKIIHLFPCRDSAATSVDLKTTEILAIAAGVEGVPVTTVKGALKELESVLTKYTYAKEVVSRGTVYFGQTS
ncbi:MAG: phenylalanine--tRNA ligase beta subunit-related protein [Sulfolobales archaeon]|nr:phenylalanine--tRNA ligase beta subunit-related protein [Sulfolobales archaeon]MCX8198598.1 phenylalanine--tRNA ligase beta subunit-related protein [Sulfolobales archaeon]MDW8169672.1 phenylalanine--tRNA ligase beta subunit-related protein [Desulfurococcaceae archaeon]